MFWFKFIILFITLINSSALQRRRRLNDGQRIPPIAFGTFNNLSEAEKIGPLVVDAIEAGYRHFDTAPMYYTEKGIGEAIINVTSRGIVTRKELYITTKLDELSNSSAVLPALHRSLDQLQLDYVDLYLIHLSKSEITGEEFDYMDIWRGMEETKRLGLAKSIGVSNFNSTHINKILANFTIRPAVNQVEAHYLDTWRGFEENVFEEQDMKKVVFVVVNPTYAQLDLVAYCQSQGIYVTSYAPFGFFVPRPFRDISPPPKFNNTVLEKIAKKYRKSTSQVVLRYLLDRGTIPIPRSINRTHIMSNINIFDFSLQPREVYAINEFDLNSPVYVTEGGWRVSNKLYEYYYGTTVDHVWLY